MTIDAKTKFAWGNSNQSNSWSNRSYSFFANSSRSNSDFDTKDEDHAHQSSKRESGMLTLDGNDDLATLLINSFGAKQEVNEVRVTESLMDQLSESAAVRLIEAIGHFPYLDTFEIVFPKEGIASAAEAIIVLMSDAKRLHTLTVINMDMNVYTNQFISASQEYPKLKNIKVKACENDVCSKVEQKLDFLKQLGELSSEDGTATSADPTHRGQDDSTEESEGQHSNNTLDVIPTAQREKRHSDRSRPSKARTRPPKQETRSSPQKQEQQVEVSDEEASSTPQRRVKRNHSFDVPPSHFRRGKQPGLLSSTNHGQEQQVEVSKEDAPSSPQRRVQRHRSFDVPPSHFRKGKQQGVLSSSNHGPSRQRTFCRTSSVKGRALQRTNSVRARQLRSMTAIKQEKDASEDGGRFLPCHGTENKLASVAA